LITKRLRSLISMLLNANWHDIQQERTVTIALPPSKDENRPPRTSSLREKSNRKAGGQPGHKGKTLEMTETSDEIIEHHSCFCPECGKDVSELPFEFSGKLYLFMIAGKRTFKPR